MAAPLLALGLLGAAEGALPPYTRALGESLWKRAERAVAGLEHAKDSEAFVCGAGNWGDGPQCDQWDQGRSPCWPSAMTVSASWDTELMARWSIEMAEEFGGANRGQLGPGVNLARLPWNGRLGEYMAGEDPHFGAQMVRAMVTAYRQVEHPPLQTVKHFVPNTIESGRQGITEVVDERTLFEVYYPPFAAAVEAGVSGVMCSYNLVQCTTGLCSGEAAYACANDDVLNKHLKQTMGFLGIVISDWDATKCDDAAIGSGGCKKKGDYINNSYAASNGLDLEMPSCVSFEGGAVHRAKEKAARMHWAYMVQGRQPDGGGGRRLQEEQAGESFCCWWPQPPGDICGQCLQKVALGKAHCPEDRVCGGGGADAAADTSTEAPTTELPTDEPTPLPTALADETTPPEPWVEWAAPRTVPEGEKLEVPGWAIKLAGGRCLEVAGEDPENGLELRQRDCEAASVRQQFSWDSSLSKIQWAAHPAFCLDVEDHRFKPGTRIQLWECLEDDEDQVFDISVGGIGSEEGAIRSHEHSHFCLAASRHAAGLELALCRNGSAAQSFSAGQERAPSAWKTRAPGTATRAGSPRVSVRLLPDVGPTTSVAAAVPPSKPRRPAPSWSTGVYEDNPFGSAAPAPPPPGGGHGPGCPDDGGDNYKSKCKLQLADKIIAESAAVLRNEGGVLPLPRDAKVALIGSEACAKDPLAQGGGSGWNGFACNEVPKVNVKDGIAGLAGVAAPWCPQKGGLEDHKVLEADVIVAVVAPSRASEGTDRATLQLSDEDTQLIRRYGELGKRMVVVINAPGPMITSTWDSVVDAILITWLPGQQNGRGVAMALYGHGHAASGRLPFTFPRCSTKACTREDELASVALGDRLANKEYRNFSEKALIGYRWYHARGINVSYPFGFGLFAYGTAEVQYSKAEAKVGDDSVVVSARLAHRGPLEGRDVPQLYLSFPESVPGDANSKPEWVLKGFTKVALKPHEPRTVSFVVPLRDLSYWDDSPGMSKWVCADGEFRACVGANARDAVAPGSAACVRFTPRCGGAAEVIAKDEQVHVGVAEDRWTKGASASRFGLVLLSALVVGGCSALALARTGCRRRDHTADGFEIVANPASHADVLHLMRATP